jgi:osmoprotectant transport system substrate-binding protein
MMRTRLAVMVTTATALALALSACGGSDALDPADGGSAAPSGSITVGSANFPESVLLAEIYAGALEGKGVEVTTRLNIGAREVYLEALEDGSIDLIPEYNGYLLGYYDPQATASGPDAVLAELKTKLPGTLAVLDQSTAQDTDAVVVTKATADRYKLTSIGDLAPVAGDLTLGGPPEWKTRATGVPGLAEKYGVTFESFRSLDAGGPLSINALTNGQVDAANIFTTDPNIAQNNWVVLQDPENLFLAANILPVITKAKVTPTVSDALNAVSAALTTENLTEMLKQVVLDKADPQTVATQFLTTNNLS